MMCGLLRRLSLDTILNLNLSLLACKQEDSCRQDRELTLMQAGTVIPHCTYIHKHTHWESYDTYFWPFKAKVVTVSALFSGPAAAASSTWQAG